MKQKLSHPAISLIQNYNVYQISQKEANTATNILAITLYEY